MKKNLFRLFLFLLIINRASAQPADRFSITHYTNENGLPQNSVKGLELDKDGFIWVATEAGLVRFDGQRFKLYDRDHYPVMLSNRMSALWLDTSGSICFRDEFEHKSGNYTFEPDGRLIHLPYKPYGGKSGQFKDNHFWVRGDTVFYKSNGKIFWKMGIPGLRYEAHNRWGHLNKKCYFRDKEGVIWCLDADKNIARVTILGLPSFPSHPAARKSLAYTLYEQNDSLYIGLGHAIYRLHERSKAVLEATLVLNTDITDIFFYRNFPMLNLQLIGTQTHGMYLIRGKQFAAYKHSNGFGNYYPVVPFGDSGILTDRGLVYPSSSRFDYPFKVSITYTYRSLLLDRSGQYWVNKVNSDHSNLIAILDRQLHILKMLPTTHAASCIRQTPDGRVWMTSYHGKRLGYADTDSIRWLGEWWGDRQAHTFLPSGNETFWVAGTLLLAHLDMKTNKITNYKNFEKYTNETLYLDSNKVLWVGTTGNGFFAIKNGSVIKFPLDKNQGLKVVHSFIEDDKGFLWMSTNNGLFRCKKEELEHYMSDHNAYVYYQCFQRESGFNTNEFNGSCTPSATRLPDGKFCFPSLDGLVEFHPDSIREALPVSKIFIDKILLDGNQQLVSGSSITIPPSFKYLEVQVASPYFGNPANQLLEYRLKGLDSAWHTLEEDNTVMFNNLRHGSYELEFRKHNGFGAEHLTTAKVFFIVKPFFYQTIYFKLILLIAVALLAFLIARIRLGYLVKRNRELENEVSQRTLKLQQANKLKEKMLMMVGHDLQSPLHFVSLLARHVQEALDQHDLDKVRTGNEEIRNTATKIHAFVEEFGLWSRMQDEYFNISKRKFLLSEVLDELAQFYKEILAQNHNRLDWKTDHEYELYTNRELLKAMLRNLLDNANKYTRNGHILIHAYTGEGNTCSISLSDNGKGMSEIELNNIRRRMANKTEAFIHTHTSKLGYQLIIDFAGSLELGLSIESRKGSGTQIVISGLQVQNIMPEDGV
jgi:signal transduction histidine kinase/streptogramin lyase